MTEVGNVGIKGIIQKELLPQRRGCLLAKSLIHLSFCFSAMNIDRQTDLHCIVGRINHTEFLKGTITLLKSS